MTVTKKRTQQVNSAPKEGALEVWAIRNPPNKGDRFPVPTPEAGARLINKMAREDLKDDAVWGNAFGMEVFEGGEWTEWYDDDGDDISVLADSLWEKE